MGLRSSTDVLTEVGVTFRLHREQSYSRDERLSLGPHHNPRAPPLPLRDAGSGARDAGRPWKTCVPRAGRSAAGGTNRGLRPEGGRVDGEGRLAPVVLTPTAAPPPTDPALPSSTTAGLRLGGRGASRAGRETLGLGFGGRCAGRGGTTAQVTGRAKLRRRGPARRDEETSDPARGCRGGSGERGSGTTGAPPPQARPVSGRLRPTSAGSG